MVVGSDKLASFDDLFGITSETESEKGSQVISIAKIIPSCRNPFKVEENSEMDQLVASIKENGILVPLILRETSEDTYDLIAGHRRLFAAKIAGLKEVPVVIREMTDEEADIIMVDTNLSREHISFSEKAAAYKMKYDAIKKKVGHNWESDIHGQRSSEVFADEMGVSDRTIKNYLRLTKLVPFLMESVDKKDITFRAGVQLSYLESSAQETLCVFMQHEEAAIDEEQAKLLREAFEGMDQIELAEIYQVLAKQEDADIPKTPKYKPVFKVSQKAKKRYFPQEYDDHDIETVIEDLLTEWAKEHNPFFGEQ